MSQFIVEVVSIDEVRHHEMADRLDVATVRGWSVVTGRDQFATGEAAIFIPIDSVLPEALVKELGIEKGYRSRLKSIKLRGIFSQGLLMKLRDGMKLGDDVASILGIEKFEEQIPVEMRGLQAKADPRFVTYTDIENIKNYPNVFTPADEVVITEKIHGCFAAKTRITLSDGSKMTIKEMVESNYRGEVLGVDAEGKVTSTPVLHTFDNGKIADALRIRFERKGAGRGNWFGMVTCTPNHQIYSNGKYVDAQNLKSGDTVEMLREDLALTPVQEQILIGKALGDGYIQDKSFSSCVSFGHKKDHLDYVKWTNQGLGDMAGTINFQVPKEGANYSGTTMAKSISKGNGFVKELFADWKKTGKKEFPASAIDKVGPIAMAFWYMDDGSLTHEKGQEDRAHFATCGFSKESVDNLCKVFSKFGIVNPRVRDYYRGLTIALTADEAEKFFLLIAPYVPPIMQYKLPERYRGHSGWLPPLARVFKPFVVTQKILAIEKLLFKGYKATDPRKYDLETGTHNFFAESILVHNSNFRASKVASAFAEGGGELLVGSHRTNLIESETNLYWRAAKLLSVKEKLDPGFQLFGEVYGAGVQDLTYGKQPGEIGVVIFDVMKDGRFLHYADMVAYLESKGWANLVPPVLHSGPWSNDLLKYAAGYSVLCHSQICEGVVIKSLIETFDCQLQGRKILKAISESYLLRKDTTATERH